MGVSTGTRRIAALLAGFLALFACGGPTAAAADFAVVTLQLRVPLYLDVSAAIDGTAEDFEREEGSGAHVVRSYVTITTNQGDWLLVASVEGWGNWALAVPLVSGEDVAVEIDVAEHKLQGSPSVVQSIAWRGNELRRAYTLVERGGAGPFQQLRLAYRFHPGLLQASGGLGPLRVVYTVVL